MKNNFSLLCLFNILITTSIFCQAPPPQQLYPKIVSYTTLFLPIVSTTHTTTTWNFSKTFAIGFATGINILYSDKFGFSFDMGPVITSKAGITKVSNFIFDPGPIIRLKKGYSVILRTAFETAGRFGESTVLAKVFSPAKNVSLITALGVPIRFGNNLPPSIGATLFFGVGFK
jgi:hypothetical protein